MQTRKEDMKMIVDMGRAIVDSMFRKGSSTGEGLVRLFEVEYSKDYRQAVRSGVHVDRRFVEEFLKSTR